VGDDGSVTEPSDVPEPGEPDEGGESPAADTKRHSFWKELPFLIVIALVLALLIKTFLVQAFYIPSASMENTLQGGNPTCNECGTSPGHPFDRVLVNKLVYDFRDPRRGEIVVFKGPPGWPDEQASTTSGNAVVHFFHDIGSAIGLAPSSDNDIIKRVIGVGGDTVTCVNDVLTVNGHALDEPYLYPGSHHCSANFPTQPVVVAKGQLFVMGDHRDDSSDSRVNGTVPVSDVVGRAFVVIWPISDWTTLGVPSTFHQPGMATAGALTASGALLLPGLLRRRRRSKR
jgi:signal peptidase I